jgi:hypothetical protein
MISKFFLYLQDPDRTCYTELTLVKLREIVQNEKARFSCKSSCKFSSTNCHFYIDCDHGQTKMSIEYNCSQHKLDTPLKLKWFVKCRSCQALIMRQEEENGGTSRPIQKNSDLASVRKELEALFDYAQVCTDNQFLRTIKETQDLNGSVKKLVFQMESLHFEISLEDREVEGKQNINRHLIMI